MLPLYVYGRGGRFESSTEKIEFILLKRHPEMLAACLISLRGTTCGKTLVTYTTNVICIYMLNVFLNAQICMNDYFDANYFSTKG